MKAATTTAGQPRPLSEQQPASGDFVARGGGGGQGGGAGQEQVPGVRPGGDDGGGGGDENGPRGQVEPAGLSGWGTTTASAAAGASG